jgi:hypothetical protein
MAPDAEMTVYRALGPSEHGNDRLMDLMSLHNEPSLFLQSGGGNLSGVNPGGFRFDFTEKGTPFLVLPDGPDGPGNEAVLGGTDIALGETGKKRTVLNSLRLLTCVIRSVWRCTTQKTYSF